MFFVRDDFRPLNTTLYDRDFIGNDPVYLSYFLWTLKFGHQNAARAVPGVNRNHLHMVDVLFNMLIQFAQQLTEEEQRGVAEQLRKEELALFDLLTRPDIELSEDQTRQVKAIARDLLATLKNGKLVLDWRKKQAARAAVRQSIEVELDDTWS